MARVVTTSTGSGRRGVAVGHTDSAGLLSAAHPAPGFTRFPVSARLLSDGYDIRTIEKHLAHSEVKARVMHTRLPSREER
jgi:hypothetical protein